MNRRRFLKRLGLALIMPVIPLKMIPTTTEPALSALELSELRHLEKIVDPPIYFAVDPGADDITCIITRDLRTGAWRKTKC